MSFPILMESDLPLLNTSCERSDIDFKIKARPAPSIEHAKDVAAIANTVGGSIVVGATTSGAVVTGYPGVAAALAAKLPEAFEQSAKDRCRPAPRVASQIILRESEKALVIVNVWPSPLAPVGVHINQPAPGAKLVDEAWVFPLRVGSHTLFLQPDQFGSLENVSARRAAALLLGIPQDERDKILLRWTRPTLKETNLPYMTAELVGEFRDVLPAKNVAVFNLGQREGDGRGVLYLPLDWIETVWHEQRSGKWIVISRAIIESPRPLEYRAARWEH